MRYVSTRGTAPVLEFEDAVLAGLARDGGLYVPEEWPQFSADQLRALSGLSYADIAFQIMQPFVDSAIDDAALKSICDDSYGSFSHEAVAPLQQLDDNLFLLELFHGPTLAFKDFALQVLGRLFDHILAKRDERITIVGATSGDTGSAAIEACRGRDAIEIFILHPKGRVSDIQRCQMTTVTEANVHNIAIDGTFDDCQDLVKAMFNDEDFRSQQNLSAVNSINWARIMAQVVYYVSSALSLGAPDRSVAYAVPTGNFGDIFAGYVALKIGLPIERLIIGTNTNDILARFMETGEMDARDVVPTLSPAMDIQVSSNFERLLFDLYGRDGRVISQAMTAFRESGTMTAPTEVLDQARALFAAARLNDDGIKRQIAATYEESGVIVDPHTATGLHAATACAPDLSVPVVALSTAHPAKFPDAVEAAIGVRPSLPPSLADLLGRPERLDTLPNDLAAVQNFVRERATN
ncbi:MAG: threonine synthase [Alphaproteobacteria bacterium]|nr:threonine synthase [Alphaproteobacteria bacterium]